MCNHTHTSGSDALDFYKLTNSYRYNWLLRLLQCQVQRLPAFFEDYASVDAAWLTVCAEGMKLKTSDES